MYRPFLLLLVVACADETALSTTEQDLSKGELEADGYTCTQEDPPGWAFTCKKCWDVTITDVSGTHTHEVCNYVYCWGGGSTCQEKVTAPSGYWLEAEATTRYQSMQTATDANASAGSYLYVAGSGSTRAQFGTAVDEQLTAWVRVIAPSSSANSIYIQLDGRPVVLAELPVSTTWTWVPIDASWFLSAGSHYLRFYAGEVGVKIDRVLLISDASDFTPVVQTYQAEAAAIVAPMTTGTQRTIPTVGYLWVPNGAGTNGLAQLQISVPYADDYAVWGRFSAPSEADNSFYIGELGEPRTTWSLPVSSGWKWNRSQRLIDFDDYDILELAQREDGTKLDKLVITNDPGFTLVNPSDPVVAQ